MHRTTSAVAVLLLTAALAACSSDGGSSPTEDDLRAAVQANAKAVNEADVPGMRQHTSKRCLDKQSDEERRNLADLVNTLYGDITFKDIEISDMSDDRAKVVAKTGIAALDKDSDGAWWVREDGSWKIDDC
jgi:hypothetical protein